MDYEFTHRVCFRDLNDFETDASFSADRDTGVVSLESVTLGDLTLTSQQVAAIMGQAHFAAQVAAVQDWWCDEGWQSADADDRAYWMEAAE